MLAGVLFRHTAARGIEPEFVNRFVMTDVYLAESASPSRRSILPSIATLLGPLTALHLVIAAILRSTLLVVASLWSATPIKRISVANTALIYHDGRALATCESGPPMRIQLPELQTVGWWSFEGDLPGDRGLRSKGGLTGFVNEWTTAHVRPFYFSVTGLEG